MRRTRRHRELVVVRSAPRVAAGLNYQIESSSICEIDSSAGGRRFPGWIARRRDGGDAGLAPREA